MSDFAGMEDLLQDFLQEAHDLLSDVDNKLVDLEKSPEDRGLLNDIFRGFHTVKGGAGFLNATELVTLCHLTENLFDRLFAFRHDGVGDKVKTFAGKFADERREEKGDGHY